MNAGATSERVYDALKRKILAGTMEPGAKLEPAVLAEELNSSVTPVRDGLHRLTGERLVETRSSEGFYLPHLHEPGLRDLYAWNDQLVRVALRLWVPGATNGAGLQEAADTSLSSRTLFELIARRTVNSECRVQVETVNDRLAAPRSIEPFVLSDLDEELRDLAHDLRSEAVALLGKRLRLYHRRRINAVPAIVRALYRA